MSGDTPHCPGVHLHAVLGVRVERLDLRTQGVGIRVRNCPGVHLRTEVVHLSKRERQPDTQRDRESVCERERESICGRRRERERGRASAGAVCISRRFKGSGLSDWALGGGPGSRIVRASDSPVV